MLSEAARLKRIEDYTRQRDKAQKTVEYCQEKILELSKLKDNPDREGA